GDSGSRTRFSPRNGYRMIAMKTSSTMPWSTKSTLAAPIVASGRTSRGKYTFVTRFALSTTERAARPIVAENRFHARIPDSRYTGKFGIRLGRTMANTRLNTARYSTGFSRDHRAPRTEEVYLTFTSLRTRLPRISRPLHSS